MELIYSRKKQASLKCHEECNKTLSEVVNQYLGVTTVIDGNELSMLMPL